MSDVGWRKTLTDAIAQLSQVWLTEEDVRWTEDCAQHLVRLARERGVAGQVVAAVDDLRSCRERELSENGLRWLLEWEVPEDQMWGEEDATEVVRIVGELRELFEQLGQLAEKRQYGQIAEAAPSVTDAGNRLHSLLSRPVEVLQVADEEPVLDDTQPAEEDGDAAPPKVKTEQTPEELVPDPPQAPEVATEANDTVATVPVGAGETGEATLDPVATGEEPSTDGTEETFERSNNAGKQTAHTAPETPPSGPEPRLEVGEDEPDGDDATSEASGNLPIGSTPLTPQCPTPDCEAPPLDQAAAVEPDRVFWQLAQEQRWAWAWWLSKAMVTVESPVGLNTLPPWLVEALWLATYCHPACQILDSQRHARERIEEQVWSVTKPFDAMDGHNPRLAAYALAASSLLPAFYEAEAPGHSAYSWLDASLQNLEAWREFPHTFELLKQTHELLSTTSLPLESWQLADRTARLNERLETIQRETRARVLEAESARTRYVYAGHAQRRMLNDEDGWIARLVEPIIRGDGASSRAQVKEALSRLADGDTVAALIQHYYRASLRKATRQTAAPLTGPARSSVEKTVDDLTHLAKEWLEVTGDLESAQEQNWSAEKAEDLRDRWFKVWPQVQSELSSTSASGPLVWYQQVILTHLSRTIATVGRNIMGHGIPQECCLPAPQMALDDARDRALWQAPQVWVAMQERDVEDWTLDRHQAELIITELAGRAQQPLSDSQVIQESCNRESFTLAAHVMAQGVEVSEETREMYQTRLRDVRTELVQECDRALSQLDEALAQGALTEEDHRASVSILDAQRSAMRADSPESGAFEGSVVRASISKTLDSIREYTQQRRDEERLRLSALQQRLDEDPEVLAAPSDRRDLARRWLEHAFAYLDAGQFDLSDAAGQQAEAALRGQTTAVQRRTCDTLRQWVARLEGLEKWLRTDRPYDHVGRLRGIAPLNFDALPATRIDECRQVGTALKELRNLQPKPKTLGRISTLLKQVFGNYVGFEISQLRHTESHQAGQPHARFEMTTSPITDPGRIAVPQFGSRAEGRYRIIVVWDTPQVSSFRNYVGEAAHQAPTFLLYPGVMSRDKWRQWAREVSRHTDGTHFLVVDECLLMHLADVHEDRLRSLFETALPYTTINPYEPFGKVPPEMFVGRRDYLLSLGGKGGSHVIYGGRQLGKSAMLEQLERLHHRPAESRWVIRDDFKSIGGEGRQDTKREFWEWVARLINSLNCPDLKIQANSKPETIVHKIEEYFRAGAPRRLLLLVDEADNFLTYDSEWDFESVSLLRRAMDRTDQNFKVIFAGLHNVQRFEHLSNHPLLQLGTPICLGPLSSLEAGELIQRPMSALGYELDDHAVLKIRVYSSDHPGLIQYFCRTLLERDRTRRAEAVGAGATTLPRTISVDDVEQVFNRDETREELRKRFRATVDLDPQYRVLVFSQLQQQLESNGTITRPFSARDALENARFWWPEGFADLDVPRTGQMLDEMVGLGVLQKQVGEELRWYVRNRQVVRLLGGADAIEAELERFLDAPPSLDPDPSRVHPRVGGKKPGISPLTQQQLALITGRDPTGSDRRTEHGVVVLQSVPASGQAYLEESVRELAWPSGKERRQKFEFRIAEDCSTAGDLRNQVAALRSTKGLEFAILWVPDQLTERWAHDIGDYIKAALERLASGKQARPVVRVLFSLGFQASWGWTTRPEHEPIKRQIAELAVRPWPQDALYLWLSKHDVYGLPESSARVRQVTGGWHALIEEFWQQFRAQDSWTPNTDPIPCLDALAGELNDPESKLARETRELLVPLAQWPDDVRELWRFLADGRPLREMDLPVLAELEIASQPALLNAFNFLCRMGYLQLERASGGDDSASSAGWVRNQVAARLLDMEP